jgi:guanylate kinase
MLAPLFILSGPSGSGKSTVLGRLLAEPYPPLHLSVSVTTRAPRPGEEDGKHYHFWTAERERFETAVAGGAFLEWAEVWGNLYGTLRQEVEPFRAKGTGVVLDIDVQGAEQVLRACPDAVTIELRTSSLAAYEERLRKRGTETEEAIQRRLRGAQRELERSQHYQYHVINDDLQAAVDHLRAIVRDHSTRSSHAG